MGSSCFVKFHIITNVTRAQGINKCYFCPLVNKNCKQVDEFYTFGGPLVFFCGFFASSLCKVHFQQFHFGMQRIKGSAACQFCRMMTSFFEEQAHRTPDFRRLLTLGAQASLKHPRAFGEVRARACALAGRCCQGSQCRTSAESHVPLEKILKLLSIFSGGGQITFSENMSATCM